MNIERLHSVLETINVAGIKEIIIEKKDDTVLIRGADSTNEEEKPSIVIVSETDHNMVDRTMGVSRVPVMLNRMNLFDLSKTKVSQVGNDDYMKSVTFKENRKKVSFTFTNPSIINVPSKTIDDNVSNVVVLSKDYIANLVKANQAMNSNLINLTGINNEIVIEMLDDGSDAFTDVVANNCEGEWSYNWQTSSVMKLLRQAIKQNDSVELGIGDVGILYIEVNELIFMVMPQVL